MSAENFSLDAAYAYATKYAADYDELCNLIGSAGAKLQTENESLRAQLEAVTENHNNLLKMVYADSPQFVDAAPSQQAPVAQGEPVAWLHPANAACVTTDPTAYARGIPLYTHPQQASEPMTDEQMPAPLLECISELGRHNKALIERRKYDVADIKVGTAKLVELERELEALRKEKQNESQQSKS